IYYDPAYLKKILALLIEFDIDLNRIKVKPNENLLYSLVVDASGFCGLKGGIDIIKSLLSDPKQKLLLSGKEQAYAERYLDFDLASQLAIYQHYKNDYPDKVTAEAVQIQRAAFLAFINAAKQNRLEAASAYFEKEENIGFIRHFFPNPSALL